MRSRLMSRRDKRTLPPRRESLAERCSRRLERRSLAEAFLPLSDREALRRSFLACFLAASALCRGRRSRTNNMNANESMRGKRLLKFIRGLLPFYGLGLARLREPRRKFYAAKRSGKAWKC